MEVKLAVFRDRNQLITIDTCTVHVSIGEQ